MCLDVCHPSWSFSLVGTVPSMPLGSSQYVIGDVGQLEHSHTALVPTLTIGLEITVSFSGMFINYGEHLHGAETILPARELVLYGYKNDGLFKELVMDENPNIDGYLAVQHVAFCLYS